MTPNIILQICLCLLSCFLFNAVILLHTVSQQIILECLNLIVKVCSPSFYAKRLQYLNILLSYHNNLFLFTNVKFNNKWRHTKHESWSQLFISRILGYQTPNFCPWVLVFPLQKVRFHQPHQKAEGYSAHIEECRTLKKWNKNKK